MGLALLDGAVVSALGCYSGGSKFKSLGSKPPLMSIVMALAVSSPPEQPYDPVHSLKKPHKTGHVC